MFLDSDGGQGEQRHQLKSVIQGPRLTERLGHLHHVASKVTLGTDLELTGE
jgi:hypothetical protein